MTSTASPLEREAARRDLSASPDAGLADHIMHHDRLERGRDTLLPLAQLLIVSGQFLLDSEASLSGIEAQTITPKVPR